MGDILPFKDHLSGCWFQITTEQVEKGGFSRSVRTNNRMQGMSLNLHANTRDSMQSPKIFTEINCFQNDVVIQCLPLNLYVHGSGDLREKFPQITKCFYLSVIRGIPSRVYSVGQRSAYGSTNWQGGAASSGWNSLISSTNLRSGSVTLTTSTKYRFCRAT